MNNLRLTVFDIFSYIIPGLCYLILIAFGLNKVDISHLTQMISKLSIYSVLAYSFISYLIGFTLEVVASELIIKTTDKIRGDLRTRVLTAFREENPGCRMEEYHFGAIYSFADVKVPNVREKADQYSAMSGLARNLSLALFAFALTTSGYAIANVDKITWLSVLVKVGTAISISVILMFRADTFRFWSHSHLLNVHYLLTQSSSELKEE